MMRQPCCLIAEDEAIIAMALEGDLNEAGIAVAGPFASSQDAICWIERTVPDIAVLDLNLVDGPCTRLVSALEGHGVPIIVLSGLPRGSDAPPELADAVWLDKPVLPSALVEAVRRLLPARSALADPAAA